MFNLKHSLPWRLLSLLTVLLPGIAAAQTTCPRIWLQNDTLFTDPAPEIQWFHNGEEIPGATQRFYYPPEMTGTFSVEVGGSSPVFRPQFGDFQLFILTGVVTDTRLQPLAGVTLRLNNQTATTDSLGQFQMSLYTRLGTRHVLRSEKEGYLPRQQGMTFRPNSTTYTHVVLPPLPEPFTFHSDEKFQGFRGPAQLTLPPRAFVTESGQPYSGEVSLYVEAAIPDEPLFGQRMPGGDFRPDTDPDEILLSYGFMTVEAQGESGETLQLDPDTTAQIQFRIDSEQLATAPDEMPFWHLKETTAEWEVETTARRNGGHYHAAVEHFSSWNLDIPVQRAYVKGRVLGCDGEPAAAGVPVHVGQRTVHTDTLGAYVSAVPANRVFPVRTLSDTVEAGPVAAQDTASLPDLTVRTSIQQALAIQSADSVEVIVLSGVPPFRYALNDDPLQPEARIPNFIAHPGSGRDSVAIEDGNGCTVTVPVLTGSDCSCKGTGSNPGISVSLEGLENAEPCSVTNLNVSERPTSTTQRLASIIPFLPCLHHLTLRDNSFTSLPPGFGQLTNLQGLYLQHNQLSSLPPEFGQLTNLTELRLDGNRLTSLPPEILQLSNLTELYLLQNQLTSLPPEFGQLTNLTELRLEDNQLTSLPPEFGQLTNLTELYLVSNQLTSLPPEIANLADTLEVLFIRGNPIPPAERNRIQSWLPNTTIYW